MNNEQTAGAGSTRLLVAVGAAVALAVALLVALVMHASSNTAAAGDIDPETRATLSVFEGPRAESDAIPESADTVASFESDSRPGENRAQSRRVDLPSGAVYVWPMYGGVCVTWGNCVPTEVVRELGVALSSDAAVSGNGDLESLKLSGIVRDGIHTVRFAMPDSADLIVPVRDNLFSVALSAVPTGMYWTDDDGRHQADPALPEILPDLPSLK